MRTSYRIEWDVLPAAVRAAVADVLGSPVVEARNQEGGFTPSLAARCRLADGRRVFLKAASEAVTNERVPDMLRSEAHLCASFPDGFPAPTLRHVLDDGEWIVLAYDEIAGRPPAQPWTEDELDRTIAALDELPTPDGLDLAPAAARLVGTFGGFRELVMQPPMDVLGDDWTNRNLELLARIEADWTEAVTGDALVHSDVRADNVLLADPPDGRVLLVDWAHSFLGADWLDLLFALPSIELGGGPPPEEVVARSVRLRRADPESVTVVAVALLGFFTRHRRFAPPPGAPAVRAFQEAQRQVARRWVESRIG